MKKNVLFAGLLSVLLLVMAACGGGSTSSKEGAKVVNIYNWAEYIPDQVIKQFEEETGIKVNYSTYASSEEMMAKLAMGNSGYDLAVPDNYSVDVMIKQGMLEKINKENIPNLVNLDPEFTSFDFDPTGDYFVPFMWGAVVLAVNEDYVDFEVTSLKDFYNPAFKNNLVVLDDPRSTIGAVLLMLGYSLNSTDEAELEEAKQKLLELTPNIKVYDSDSPKSLLVSGEAIGGLVWGTEASLAARENPAIKTVLPVEGMNLYQDNFVIPKGAPNKENAEAFLNFILRPDVSKEISLEYPYANPNHEARKLLPAEILEDVAVYPPQEELDKGEYMIDVGEFNQVYDRIWTEVKR